MPTLRKQSKDTSMTTIVADMSRHHLCRMTCYLSPDPRSRLTATRSSDALSLVTDVYSNLICGTLGPSFVISIQSSAVTIDKNRNPNILSIDCVSHFPAMPKSTTLLLFPNGHAIKSKLHLRCADVPVQQTHSFQKPILERA